MSDKRFFLYVWLGLLAGVVIVLAGAFGIHMLSTALVPVAKDAVLFFASLSFVNRLFVAGLVLVLGCAAVSGYVTLTFRRNNIERTTRTTSTSELAEADTITDRDPYDGGGRDE